MNIKPKLSPRPNELLPEVSAQPPPPPHHPGELVPEENFWTLQCKGRLTEVDTLTIRLGTTPFGLTSAYLHRPPIDGDGGGSPSVL